MIVLDTNVLSEVMKPMPAPAVAQWMVRERGRGLFTTAVSEAEIIYGIAILPDGRRKRNLGTAAQAILGLFVGRILPFDSLAAREFAAIVADRRSLGRPINDFDAQIAAITRAHGMTLATRDTRDFAETGVLIIDPWEP
jgi:predicted nucleic acid-binding protein